MKKLCCVLTLLALFGCASQPKETYMGYDVIQLPIALANGEEIQVKITDSGVIPAQKDGFTMTFAGFNTLANEAKNTTELVWGFAFTKDNDHQVQRVTVQELAPTVKNVVDDQQPQIVNGEWRINLAPIPLTKASTPWVFSGEYAAYLFRVTIELENEQPIVLDQLVYFSKEQLQLVAKQSEYSAK